MASRSPIEGFHHGLLGEAVSGENGVSAYGAALLLAAAVWGSSIVFVPFFLNFPVKGKPLTVRQYVNVPLGHHALGLVAGIVWTAGLLGTLVVSAAPGPAQPSPLMLYMLSHAGPLLATALGLLVWGEFKGAPTRANAMVLAVIVLLAAGMGMIAVAPVYGK